MCRCLWSKKYGGRTSIFLEQPWSSILWHIKPQMLIRACCGEATAGGALNESELEEVGLVHFFYRRDFFRKCGGDGAEADGSAFEFFDDDLEDFSVECGEPKLVYFKECERVRDILRREVALVYLR